MDDIESLFKVYEVYIAPCFPFLNMACPLRSIGSRIVNSLFRITLLKNLLVMDSTLIPLQLFAEVRFSLFGSITIRPVFQSTGCSYDLIFSL